MAAIKPLNGESERDLLNGINGYRTIIIKPPLPKLTVLSDYFISVASKVMCEKTSLNKNDEILNLFQIKKKQQPPMTLFTI